METVPAPAGPAESGGSLDEGASHVEPQSILSFAAAVALGDVSADRQFAFLGRGNGWQLRPMQNRLENGRFTHVDDPVGHMHRMADTSPVTPQELVDRRNSGGS